MKRRFALPVAIVLAAHVVFFFVSRKPLHATVRSPAGVESILSPITIIEPMDTVSANNESGGPSNTRATEPPTLPEPPTNPNFSGPTIDVPPRRPFSPGPFARIEPGLSGPFRVRDGAGSSRSGIFDPAMLDNPPQTRFQGTPAYPFEAKQAGQSGEVIVEFAVDGELLAPASTWIVTARASS